MNTPQNTDLRQSVTSWITLLGACALIISAIILAFGTGRDGVISDFLLNAGLFLGIQKFGNVASERYAQKYSSENNNSQNPTTVDVYVPQPPAPQISMNMNTVAVSPQVLQQPQDIPTNTPVPPTAQEPDLPVKQ